MQARIEGLRAAPIFAGLSGRSLERVARAMSEVEVPAGGVLIEPNQKGSGMYVIREGTVTVQTRRLRVELGPGDVVGELALLSGKGLRNARVRAKTPLRCLALSRPEFDQILAAEPRLAVALLELAAQRLAESE